MRKIVMGIYTMFIVLSLCACTNMPQQNSSSSEINAASIQSSSESMVSQEDESSYSPSSSYTPKAEPSFTNKFGTATTRCNHVGCTNYIAASGDTNSCTTHSMKCHECSCYIDEGALWCISCTEATINSMLEEKKKVLSEDCDICGKQATQTINGEFYCDKHYKKALAWYEKQ